MGSARSACRATSAVKVAIREPNGQQPDLLQLADARALAGARSAEARQRQAARLSYVVLDPGTSELRRTSARRELDVVRNDGAAAVIGIG